MWSSLSKQLVPEGKREFSLWVLEDLKGRYPVFLNISFSNINGVQWKVRRGGYLRAYNLVSPWDRVAEAKGNKNHEMAVELWVFFLVEGLTISSVAHVTKILVVCYWCLLVSSLYVQSIMFFWSYTTTFQLWILFLPPSYHVIFSRNIVIASECSPVSTCDPVCPVHSLLCSQSGHIKMQKQFCHLPL